ncbi:MAG TPA: undecaprenyl-diphosphate phosphatase [Candidatus Rhabdochlamydia sp.]|jgi:undecaprenyl-diphosphatase|nr:undecaprenyl-diphosphate phosphatase [Candidatus Rhabdochlamydia sp.]
MSLLEAFLLGLIQGLTEFFPVSSSAHLALFKLMLGIQDTETQVILSLFCHLGTLLAVIVFLKQDILTILRTDRKKALLLFLAIIPLIPCYLLVKPFKDWVFNPNFLGFGLMFTGFVLLIGHFWRLKVSLEPSFKKRAHDALYIGAMQSMAFIPGVSRSASTICCARVLGWKTSDAVRFSFLLSIPTIIGGNCLELLQIVIHDAPRDFSPMACIVGFITSCLVGLLVIRFAFSILEKGNFKPFAWYCLILGFCSAIYLNY